MLSTSFAPLAGVVLVTGAARLVPWRRIPPRVALWTLTAASLVGASVVVVAVAVLAGGFLLGTPAAAWTVEVCSLFAGHHRVPPAVGVSAAAVLGVIAWRVGAVLASVRTQNPSGVDPLTVVAADEPIAFARPGRRGGVVVSTGMLAALRPDERRVLFAHERAHVRARHDLHLLTHAIGAAALPWLGRLGDDVRLAAERAADAAALAEVGGDRHLVATAIARAALAADAHRGPTPALSFIGGAVAFRVQSILRPGDGAPLPASLTGTLAAVGALSASVFLHHLATLLAHVCV